MSENEVKEEKQLKSEFAAVVFNNIPETYPADAHIECSYTITEDIVPCSRDYIGLFRVGWMVASDYIYYEWAPYPKDYVKGKEIQASVMFPAHKMPGDDGEFYQFCYVSGQVRGASTPFQFKRPHADEFVEIEDDEPDMLVIRSKTNVLKEKLQNAEEEKQKLLEMKGLLEMERQSLVAKLTESNKALREETENRLKLEGAANDKQEKIASMCKEARDMSAVRDYQAEKITQLEEQSIAAEKHISQLTSTIETLNIEMHQLAAEKEELSGMLMSLKGEKELFKAEFSSVEISAKKFKTEIEELQEKRLISDKTVDELTKEIDSQKKLLRSEKKKMERQKSASMADKDHVEMLNERLKNAEDKLQAADNIKILMNDEITCYRATQQRLSLAIEEKETECHELKEKMTFLDQEYKEQCDELMQACSNTQQENESLKDDIVSLKKQMDKEKTESSSIFHMKEAQQSLKERYVRVQKQCSDLQEELAKSKKQSSQQEVDLTREIEDLKERIEMCTDEYKTVYMENRKLRKKAEKSNEKADELSPSGSSDSLHEMKRQVKASKYKKLYAEEKEQQETLRKHYYEEQKKAADETDLYRKKLETTKNDHTLKMRSMENFLAEKDKEIDELRRRIRSELHIATELHQKDQASAASGNEAYPKYPFLMYGNPYEKEMAAMHPIPQGLIVYPNQIIYKDAAKPLVYPHPVPQYEKPQDRTFVYPHEVPPECKKPEPKLETDCCEGIAPLTPLPPPMEPEKLPSAKVAAVKTHLPGDNSFDLDLMTSPEFPYHVTEMRVNIPKLEADEDRFVDAIGDGMKICPVCKESFPPTKEQIEFDEHILAHFGKICPICKKQMDMDTPDSVFEDHVNACMTRQHDEVY